MSIIKWVPDSNPNTDLEKWFFGDDGAGRALTPAVDVYEEGNNVIVEAPIAGFDPAKVHIQFEDGVLMISGELEQKKEVDDKNYYRKEVRSGKFFRSVAMPIAVEESKAEAEYENGVLKIMVPKAPAAQKRDIKINIKK